MGHSSINVTVDIYGHLVPGGNRQAVDKLDNANGSKENGVKSKGGNKNGNNWREYQI
jgi:hypothetical protein